MHAMKAHSTPRYKARSTWPTGIVQRLYKVPPTGSQTASFPRFGPSRGAFLTFQERKETAKSAAVSAGKSAGESAGEGARTWFGGPDIRQGPEAGSGWQADPAYEAQAIAGGASPTSGVGWDG